MTFAMFIRTVLEFLMFGLIMWGIFHEDRLAAFEHNLLAALRRRRLRVVKPDFSKTNCARDL